MKAGSTQTGLWGQESEFSDLQSSKALLSLTKELIVFAMAAIVF
jgi:hypothetical protein